MINNLFLRTIAIGGTVFLLTVTGCAVNGPLIKPSQDTRREYVSKHPWLDKEIKQAILEGKVIKGMTREDVRAAWGKPSKTDDFSTDPNAWWYDSDGEGWWYKPFPVSLEPTRFVKFKNGFVNYTTEDYK